MKIRPTLFLLLLAAALAVFAWLYHIAARPAANDAPAERAEVHDTTLDDLEHCCHRKHIKAAQYDRFAAIALREKRPAAARLFRALALSERLQEGNCASVIIHLGGSYEPPERALLFRGTTDDNLARAIDYLERSEIDPAHAIDRAMQAGNRYASRVLIWAAAIERRHAALMPHARQEAGSRYLLCPVCGNLYRHGNHDPYCPHCFTSQRQFIAIAPK